MKKWYEMLPQEVFGEEQKLAVKTMETGIGYTGLGADGRL